VGTALQGAYWKCLEVKAK